MTPAAVLAALRAEGVRVTLLDGGRLSLVPTPTPRLLRLAIDAKPALLRLVTAEAAPAILAPPPPAAENTKFENERPLLDQLNRDLRRRSPDFCKPTADALPADLVARLAAALATPRPWQRVTDPKSATAYFDAQARRRLLACPPADRIALIEAAEGEGLSARLRRELS